MNLSREKKIMDMENRLVVTKAGGWDGLGEWTCGCQGGRGGSGMDWVLGVNRCRLLPLEWISNEILRNTTMGEKKYVHM